MAYRAVHGMATVGRRARIRGSHHQCKRGCPHRIRGAPRSKALEEFCGYFPTRGSARVNQFSPDGWRPILLRRPAREVQATQHQTWFAVYRDKIDRALGGLHLVGHSKRADLCKVVQAKSHPSGTSAAEPEIFRPFEIRRARVRIAFKTKEPALLQVAERLFTRRIAALIKQNARLTQKFG